MNAAKLSAAVCRWTARLIGTLLILFSAMIAIGEHMPNPLSAELKAQAFIYAYGVILLGFAVGWRWELFGGMMSLAGCGLLAGVIAFFFGKPSMFLLIPFLVLPGALYVASARLRRRARGAASTATP